VTADAEAAEARVWAATPIGTREILTTGLAGSELRTLLMTVARDRASQVRPTCFVSGETTGSCTGHNRSAHPVTD
jgi:hypothetical protein